MLYKNYAIGIFITAIIAILAIFVSKIPAISALHLSPLIISVLLGVILSFAYHKRASICDMGITFSAKKLLRFGIILYGFNVTIAEIYQVGLHGILSCILVVVLILSLGTFIGVKILKMPRDLALLVSGGSAICGAAAILALESSSSKQSNNSVLAVGIIVIFGLIGMFAYPIIYASGILGFNDMQEGFYIGLTLHEVANAVGAGGAISNEAASFALITKMIRVILLVPVLFIIPLLLKDSNSKSGFSSIPWFALWFLAVIILHSYVEIPESIVDICKFISALCLSMAMCALGLQINFAKLSKVGGAALKLGFILFLILSIGGFCLVKTLVMLGVV